LDARGQLDPAVAGVASLAMWERGDLASAKRWIAMGQRGDGTASAECLVAAAYAAMANRASLAEAGRLADEACSRWPDDGRTWAARGLIQLLNGNAEGASPDLERATVTAPRYGLAWRGLGWAQILLGKPAVAEQSFKSALGLDERHSESHGGLAVSLLIQRQEPEAQSSLLTCRSLDAESPSGAYGERLLVEGSGATLNLSEILARLS
jgi:Flp pilus assembly protein TadD